MTGGAAAGSALAAALTEIRAAIGAEHTKDALVDRIAYDCDGTTIVRQRPAAVVMPATRDEVVAVMVALARHGIAAIGRGAGTGLSGGAIGGAGEVIVSLARMRRIVEIDCASRIAVVEPGVVNAELSRAVRKHGLHFAPDPSSQASCTIGGNVALNSGGPHTLKYGVTVNHVLALEIVRPGGAVVRLGGRGAGAAGLDLAGFFCGSEGTLGLATEITVKLTPLPAAWRTMVAVFADVAAATAAVSAIIAAGVIPAALELLDAVMLEALNAAFAMNFPLDAGALLLIELDGHETAVADEAARVVPLLRASGALRVDLAANEGERARLWKARKQAFGAIGRLSPAYLTQDGVVPRTRLVEALARIAVIALRRGLRVANVFHAGDGNLHPCLLYDPATPGQRESVLAAGEEILDVCLEMGGSITGEHGVGLEKREALARMFAPADLNAMLAVAGVFDPQGLANPTKVIPRPGGCGETRALRR